MRQAAALALLAAASGAWPAQTYHFDLEALGDSLGHPITEAALESAVRSAMTGVQALDVLVNGRSAGVLRLRIFDRNGALHAELPYRLVQELPLAQDVEAAIFAHRPDAVFSDAVAELPGSRVVLDAARQRVRLEVPQKYLARAARILAPEALRDWGETALLAGWSAAASTSRRSGWSSRSASLTSALRFNAGRWRLFGQAAASLESSRGTHSSSLDVHRMHAARVIEPLHARFLAGDFSSRSRFGEPLPVRGAGLYDDWEQAEPGSVRYAPSITGIARCRSRVLVRQDGHLIHEETVPAGPFDFSHIRGLADSGRITVDVEGEDGSRQSFAVPFAAAQRQLASGRWTWSAAAGRGSGASGRRPLLVQAEAGRGLAGALSGLTLYGAGVASDDFSDVRAGLSADAGYLGAVSLDAAQSHRRGRRGQALRFSWVRDSRENSASLQATWTRALSGRYEQAGDVLSGGSAQALRDSLELSASRGFLAGAGSLSVSGWTEKYEGSARRSRISLQASLRIGAASLSLALQRSGGVRRDTSASLSLSLPLFPQESPGAELRASAEQAQGAAPAQSVMLSGSPAGSRNLRASVTALRSRAAGSSLQAAGSWTAPAGEFSALAAGGASVRSLSLSGSGGAALWRDGFALGRSLYDGLAVVRVPGADGVRLVGGLDRSGPGGTVLASGLANYHFNEIALDPESVPPNVSVPTYVKRIVPADGALVKVDFEAVAGTQALFALRLPSGSPVPFAAAVTVTPGAVPGLLADEGGLVYIASAPAKGMLQASWQENGRACRCSAPFAIGQGGGQTQGLWRATLVCQPDFSGGSI